MRKCNIKKTFHIIELNKYSDIDIKVDSQRYRHPKVNLHSTFLISEYRTKELKVHNHIDYNILYFHLGITGFMGKTKGGGQQEQIGA